MESRLSGEMNKLHLWHQELCCFQVSVFVINEHSTIWTMLWTAPFLVAVLEVLIFASTPSGILFRCPMGVCLPPPLLVPPLILTLFQFRCLVCASFPEPLTPCSVTGEHNFIEEITNSCHAQLFQGDLLTPTVAHQHCEHIQVVQTDHEPVHIFEHLVRAFLSTWVDDIVVINVHNERLSWCVGASCFCRGLWNPWKLASEVCLRAEKLFQVWHFALWHVITDTCSLLAWRVEPTQICVCNFHSAYVIKTWSTLDNVHMSYFISQWHPAVFTSHPVEFNMFLFMQRIWGTLMNSMVNYQVQLSPQQSSLWLPWVPLQASILLASAEIIKIWLSILVLGCLHYHGMCK